MGEVGPQGGTWARPPTSPPLFAGVSRWVARCACLMSAHHESGHVHFRSSIIIVQIDASGLTHACGDMLPYLDSDPSVETIYRLLTLGITRPPSPPMVVCSAPLLILLRPSITGGPMYRCALALRSTCI